MWNDVKRATHDGRKKTQLAGRRVSLVTGTSRGLVLDLIRAQGPISRVKLAEVTGLTQATMSTVVRQLLADGLVIDDGHGESTGGKPPVLLRINPQSRHAVGVQLGSESITYVTVNLSGAIVGRLQTLGVGSSDPDRMIPLISEQIESMLESLGIDKQSVVGIGVVAPGPLDLARGVILGPPHLKNWDDVPIRARLADATQLPVVLDNDATAAAIGDFWAGGVGDAKSHATIYMGSGIGSGLLIDGTVLRGASSNAGEIGQLVVTLEGTERRTLEQAAIPAAVVRKALETPESARRVGVRGEDDFADFKALALAAIHDDPFAQGLIEQSAEHVATAVASLANTLDLDSVSLAGPSFALAGSIYIRVISRRLEDEFFARARHGIRVRLSTHVSDAAAVGGAALVLQTELAPRSMGLTSSDALG
jgi:predicted NBD/HSP70 family sugar kinase